ncbi:MAG: ketoacyl-ACP synthase III [Acidimicrobiia bacterium]|nr:ketoacyl-ACP synthase III [Acidimicrobiia bacterium]
MSQRYAEITGWGTALPPAVLTNDDMSRIVETSDDWIASRTGIKERRISHVDVSELGRVAGLRAIAAAGLEPDQIDMVINATCTPENLLPATAGLIQDKIGATGAGAMDLNANCSGFVYAHTVADSMVKTGVADRVLVLGVEKFSYIVDWTDRSTCVLFGDGAGAIVIEATDRRVGLMASELGNDGSAAEHLCLPGRGTAGHPAALDPLTAGVRMNGPEIFRRAVTMMGEASQRVVEAAGWQLDEVDLLVPHQANQRILDATARRLGLDNAKVFSNLHAYGNTSAATIPIALAEALEQGRVTPGSNLVFVAFGGGLSWAASAIKWGDRTEPVGTSDATLPAFEGDALELLRPNIEFFGGSIAP